MLSNNQPIKDYDPELWKSLEGELNRQEEHIELIASENYTSKRVLEAQGSVLTNKYAEGYPGKRYYGGCEFVDIAESLAIERAKELFDADFANVQPHSGSSANLAVYMALCEPGDVILGMSLDHGGHLSHGTSVNFSGKTYKAFQYGLNEVTGDIDYKQVESLASQGAVALTNKRLVAELKALFEAFIKLIATAIDKKSPYTGGHCERVP